MGQYTHSYTKSWSSLINSYDGIILLFPQDNSDYPASLKNALDYLGKEWDNKPISMVTYGGHGGPQAQIAMKLSLNPTDNKDLYLSKLHTYDFEAKLLRQEFEYVL